MILLMLLVTASLLLVIISSIKPCQLTLSEFERSRRMKNGDSSLEYEHVKASARGVITSFQRILAGLLIVTITSIAIFRYGWTLGLVISILITLLYSTVAHIAVVHRISQKLYERYEPKLATWAASHIKYLRYLSVQTESEGKSIASRDELLDVIKSSPGIISSREAKQIKHLLQFEDKEVRDIMTPRSKIKVVKKSEMLGPLVLNELHKTGHNRFPVIQGDIDHVVGVLHLRDVLKLDTSRRHTAIAETAMEKRVFYIQESDSLSHALSAFLSTHHHQFIVINGFRETVGLLTLEDTMEALLGTKIIDEFDTHDDIRAVAARAPSANQPSANTTDV